MNMLFNMSEFISRNIIYSLEWKNVVKNTLFDGTVRKLYISTSPIHTLVQFYMNQQEANC